MDDETPDRPSTSMSVARNIVNQLADLWHERIPSSLWVSTRQATNDTADEFVKGLVETFARAENAALLEQLRTAEAELLEAHNHFGIQEGRIRAAEVRAAEAEAVIEEVRGAWTGPDIDEALEGAPSDALARVKAKARESALREAAASIVEGAPPINAELNPVTGAQDDDGMAAYIEGLHTAHAAVMALVQIDDQAKKSYRAGAER